MLVAPNIKESMYSHKNERGTDAMEWNREEQTKWSPTPGAERGRLGPGVGTSGLTVLEATTKSALVDDG